MMKMVVSLPFQHKVRHKRSAAFGLGDVHVSVLRQTNGQGETQTDRAWSDMKLFEVVDILY